VGEGSATKKINRSTNSGILSDDFSWVVDGLYVALDGSEIGGDNIVGDITGDRVGGEGGVLVERRIARHFAKRITEKWRGVENRVTNASNAEKG